MMRSLFDAPAMPVGELCRKIRTALRVSFPASVRVFGEVSASRTIAGNTYFTLKDSQGLIECYCYRETAARLGLPLPIPDGTAVEVAGVVDIYERRSAYQLRVLDVVPVGKGALHVAFERLKADLEREGLFDAARKRPIPSFISDVAIVTSRNAAALADFVTTCRRRGAHVRICLVHAPVNGAAAAPELARAIDWAGRLPVDVVVVARGGGSTEDLWAFNTERVARAIAACAKPVISAVGHETDVTIADFVADMRVATPTAAAEFVANERAALLARVAAAQLRARRALLRCVAQPRNAVIRALRDLRRARADALATRAQRVDDTVVHLRRGDPRRRMRLWSQRAIAAYSRLAGLASRTVRVHADVLRGASAELDRALADAVKRRRGVFDVAAARLDALGPRRTLQRGYAIVYDAGGSVLVNSAAVDIGEKISVELKSGSLAAVVREKKDEYGEDGRQEDAGI
jgi:exodeoxyribonuclease VII large subunit